MPKFLTLITLFLLPFYCCAQFTITGKVINTHDKKPVAGASVFFNRAGFGSPSDNDGTFRLAGVKNGQYELIITAIGYETYTQTLLVNNDIELGDIALKPKAIGLKEVKIRPDPNRERYYQVFKQRFLGFSENARQCEILNPEILDISYESKTLTVSADEFLLIENKALGYKIRYLLKTFVLNGNEGTVFYDGYVSFENMSGSDSQQKKWRKNRLKAYLGSQMHFLRTAIGNQLDEEGFRILKLKRTPVKKPFSDSAIRAKIAYYRPLAAKNHKLTDSLFYWYDMLQLPKVTEKLSDTALNINNILKRTDKKIVYALTNPDCLYIMYTKRKNYYDNAIYHPSDIPHCPITIVTFKSDYLFFDVNGGVVNPEGALMEGFWGNERIADSLPLDYEPGETKTEIPAEE